MIPTPTGVRVWLAAGAADMRCGMGGLALQVRQALGRDPHGGGLYVFRGCRGGLVKCLWHDDTGMSLYVKRLERGRFVWPQAKEGVVSLTPAMLSMLLEVAFRRARPPARAAGAGWPKLGEEVTEALEVVPRQWKVIQTVRERFTCRACETTTQPPAPFHPIARGRAGPELLAMIPEAKFGQHLPLNRQSGTYAREGVEIDVSTMADWVGACTATLAPLTALTEAHVRAAARIHGDDLTVPAAMYSLVITAKLNDGDPRAWLADVLRRIAGHPASRLHELLPWNWRKPIQDTAAAA